MNVSKLSVFLPAYNEEGNIKKTVEQAVSVLDNLKLEYEVIVVDDGSKDNTSKIAQELADKNSRIRIIKHEKNLGYGSALKTGFRAARYPWVAFADSDGQFDFSEISLLIDKADNADLVLGYRITRADSFSRKVFTFGWSMLARILLGLDVKDYSCGFKLIKKEVFEKVQPLEGEEKVTQIEFLVKAKRLGFKIAEVGLHHYPRKFGTPTGAKLTVVFKSLLDLFKLWWQINDQKLAFFVLLGIVLLATFLRFYRLDAYMTFLGDEGRDAIIIKELLTKGDIPFIGPPTSVGNIYLGPLYYYMMAVPMGIFWLNPVAASGMVAFIGVLTVLLVYYITKSWFGKWAGNIAAFLYAISPVTVFYSRSSWNPNPAPFYTLLAMVGIYQAHKRGNYFWLILTGFSIGAAIQMHYLALILLPIFGILWIYDLYAQKTGKLNFKHFFAGTVCAILAFLVTLIPLILFDLKHDFLNYKALTQLFTNGSDVKLSLINIIGQIPILFSNNLIGRYIAGQNEVLTGIVVVLTLMPFIYIFFQKSKIKSGKWPFFVLFTWIFVGLLGVSLYQKSVYDHYIGFLSPVPFILLGYAIVLVGNLLNQKTKYLGISVAVLFIAILAWFNLQNNPLQTFPNNQLQRTQEVAKFVIRESNNQPFNFALIAQSNYDSAYQFYLDIYNHKPKPVPKEITKQLFVVCEDAVCNPAYSSKYEVAAFGMSKVESVQEFMGVKVYKLVANPEGVPQ